MLSAHHISQWYGPKQVLSDLTFSVDKGEIVGFLGPNGAGKSTTMKILTGYMLPTTGEVTIHNKKMSEEATELKALIGYLPENNPLYTDFTVEETLLFHADMRGLKGRKKITALRKAVERCGLEEVFYSSIQSLSKGYRQRVGLSTAIIHEPKILILDEPTSGLDPRQIIEIRDLLQTLGKDHTILFSTHIMQEVQAICQRVLIINKGKLVAEGSPASLGGKKGETTIHITSTLSPEDCVNELESQYKVIGAKRQHDKTTEITLKIEDGVEARQVLLRELLDKNIPVLSFIPQEQNLEEIFLELTT